MVVAKPPPEGTDLLVDMLIDDGGTRSHEQRIERLIVAALPDPGQRLQLQGELARGGMGAVRLAFDATLQRRMAAKTMHASTCEHMMLVHGFLREAQVTGQLDHPNIVPIHELGRDATGQLYFTMKLVEGQSLKALIGGAPTGDLDRLFNLLEIYVKICDALGFAHARGVLHCDIKSANVMVGEFGQVYLMDWGGAQQLPPRPGSTRASGCVTRCRRWRPRTARAWCSGRRRTCRRSRPAPVATRWTSAATSSRWARCSTRS